MRGCRAGGRREAEGRDIPGKKLGRRLAVSGKGRIGRDRLDPQQGEQPFETVVEIGIDAVENRLQLRRVGHFYLSLARLPFVSGCSTPAPSVCGCRMCQTNPPDITAAAARLFPYACRSLGNARTARHT